MLNGEKHLVFPVVDGPILTYRHDMKHNTSIDKSQQNYAVRSKSVTVRSKINVHDIAKYFNYPNKESRLEHGISKLWSIKNKTMGSNFSRHHGKGLSGRRTQSSGNLCDSQGRLNDVSEIFIPCSSTLLQRYNVTGSLPNSLDNDEQPHDLDKLLDNNNISDSLSGDLRRTRTHTKSYHQENFYDKSLIGTELVKYHSHESLKGDPWKYQQKHKKVELEHCNSKSSIKSQIVTYQGVIKLNENKYSRVDVRMNNTTQDSKTLPIRRIDPKWCDPISIQAVHQKKSIDPVDCHQSDCQSAIHWHSAPIPNFNSQQLVIGEHYNQDQGYASERSPEDEHSPFLSGESTHNVNPRTTFRIILQKSSRGLGLSVYGGGTIGPIRVKRLFPQQPAALCNQLKPGDILLSANGISLSGLTNYEALEVLRTTSNTVELLVCRPTEETSITPPGDPPTPPARRKPPPDTSQVFNPVPPLHIEPCGEFDIELTKVSGSLGFTLRKVDSSALGHYVRALVREPALSDGRIQPGDKIVAVDDTLLSPMSHEEAVSLLRQCGPKVKLRLYRDSAQTPVSALSPTESDYPSRPSNMTLRQEAVDMLCDLAVKKLSPTTLNGLSNLDYSGVPAASPRRLRKPLYRTSTAENDEKGVKPHSLVSDSYFTKANGSKSQIEIPLSISDSCDAIKLSRPIFLDLSLSTERKEFTTGVISNFEIQEHAESITDTATIATTVDADVQIYDHNYQCHSINSTVENIDNNLLPSEPVSMPPLVPSSEMNTDPLLNHKNPLYQSAKQTLNWHESNEPINYARSLGGSYSSDHETPVKVSSGTEDPIRTKGLLKWKGVMFAPNIDTNSKIQFQIPDYEFPWHDCEIFMVELTRGWNSRLGFSLQSHDDVTVISMVHPDSVAAKDGRLKQGDILVMINDENVQNIPTSDIIDLLRRIRGFICITVARRKTQAICT